MDNSNAYRLLGRKTFWLFVLERSQPALILLLIAIVILFIPTSISTAGKRLPDNISSLINLGDIALVAFLAAIASLILAIFIGWLVYVNYKFMLTEDALKIERGIFSKEEVAIPYRQIQDVDVDKPFVFRIMGLSKLIILTAGHEDKNAGDQSEGIIPAIDSGLADKLQAELLKRADIEVVVGADKS